MRGLIDYDVYNAPIHGQKTMLKRLRGMFSTDLHAYSNGSCSYAGDVIWLAVNLFNLLCKFDFQEISNGWKA